MTGRHFLGAVFAAALLTAGPAGVSGEEKKLELRPNDTVKTLLADRVGQPVVLLLASGQELGGVVVSVGDGMVHLSKLTGREFYDGALRLEAITGVIVRTRSK